MQLMINGIPNEVSEDTITKTCNMLRAVEKYGHVNPEDIRSFAKELLQGNIPVNNTVHDAITMHKKVLDTFVKHLAKTLRPLLHGISRQWRKTQDESLRAKIRAFERGYCRLLSEIPTGAGKSMLIGAIVRSALDTMKELSIDHEIHIVTSRIAIAGQLIDEDIPEEQKEDRPLDIGKKGDVRLWCPEVPDEKIRVLAGTRGQNLKEKSKDATITVSTYQGLTANRVSELFKKTPFIVIFDESHHVTERVAIIGDQFKCLAVGMSATVLGPERDPFFFFERIERPELLEKKKTSYIDFLAYHKSMSEMIKDQELKPVRWFNSRLKIDMSGAVLKTTSKGPFDIFNEASVSKILAKNPELLSKVVEEAYTEEHLGLTLAGSKQVRERRGIAFVDRVETAKTVCELVNKSIPQKLIELYGDKAYFKAGFVDGKMSQKEYEATIAKFRSGEITLMFSVKKIGEGVDLPMVDMVLFLRPFGLGSMWELIQALGRGTRLDTANLFADLLVLDMVFVSDRHLLASVLGIFGRSTAISGGLITGWGNSYHIEKKVFDLLKKGRSWKEIWESLSEEERDQFPVLKEKMQEELRGSKASYTRAVHSESLFTVEEIHFVEQEDVRLALSLGNHEEMMRYIVDVLNQEGFNTLEQLRRVQQSSLPMFQRRRFRRFRDGLTMVNLALKEKNDQLTAGSFTDFMQLLKQYGMKDRIISQPTLGSGTMAKSVGFSGNTGQKHRAGNNLKTSEVRVKPKTTVVTTRKDISTITSTKDLLEDIRSMFGVEPDINSIVKDLYGKEPEYANQATVALPEGLKFSSVIWRNKDREAGKNQAAAELHKIILDQKRSGNIGLYYGSVWFMNHIKMVYMFLKERDYSQPFFTTTLKDGIYITMATIEKFKWKINGNAAIGTDEERTKKHALVMLGREISKMFHEEYAEAHLIEPRNIYRKKLDNLCISLGTNPKKWSEQVRVGNVDISKTNIVCNGIKIESLGVNIANSQEKAAKEMYQKLLDQVGGTTEN